jgi:hypothetical protein
VTSPGFIAEPPLATARRRAERDMAGRARPGEVRWLHDNPVWWLRALCAMERNVNHKLSELHNGLRSGEAPRTAQEHAEHARRRALYGESIKPLQRYKRKVEHRKAEVISLFGRQGPVPGDLVRVFTEIALMIDEDDTQGVRDLALYWADTLGKKSRP